MYFQEYSNNFQFIRKVPRTGVIYVMGKAAEQGFHYGHEAWSNLGQGAPETGPLPDAPDRLTSIPLTNAVLEYGPVAGIPELRDAVAALYNKRYRRGMPTQYSAENVAISSGGRVGLARIASALSSVNLGHFLPDYTAYEELLDLFRGFVPIPIMLSPENGFFLSPDLLRERVVGMGIGAVLMSNPCNPTGQLVQGEALAGWVEAGRELHCMLIFDEFYAHYLYDDAALDRTSLSACAHVEDVDTDPVIILDGLTKNWRYPGLRLSWTIGPKKVIQHLSSAGSFLDGGAPHAVQKSAIPLLEPACADLEAKAIQKHFAKKRAHMLERIEAFGMGLVSKPKGGFYCFVSLDDLPAPLQSGKAFFEEALRRKVICVPGVFFDVNPGRRRGNIPSRLEHYVRLSYGPPAEEVEKGLDRIEAMIHSFY